MARHHTVHISNQSPLPHVVVLTTGGTIAGLSSTGDDRDYQAAQLDGATLIAGVTGLSNLAIVEVEEVARLDSKDMSLPVWQQLYRRVAHHLARRKVAGIVVTHGTDTLEETSHWLHLLAGQQSQRLSKPVVLTGAMRPASSRHADGPGNLMQAVALAGSGAACGVVAVLHGRVHEARYVRKCYASRVDAFRSMGQTSGNCLGRFCVTHQALAQPKRLRGGAPDSVLLHWNEAALLALRDWTEPPWLERARQWLQADHALEHWPRVALLFSHAGLTEADTKALLWQRQRGALDGVVVVATGSGTLHEALLPGLQRLHSQGVLLRRCSRVLSGDLYAHGFDAVPLAQTLSPFKARVELLLELLAARA